MKALCLQVNSFIGILMICLPIAAEKKNNKMILKESLIKKGINQFQIQNAQAIVIP